MLEQELRGLAVEVLSQTDSEDTPEGGRWIVTRRRQEAIRRSMFMKRADLGTPEGQFALRWTSSLESRSSNDRVDLVSAVFGEASQPAFELLSFACGPAHAQLHGWLIAAAQRSRSGPLKADTLPQIDLELWTSWPDVRAPEKVDWHNLRAVRTAREHSGVWVAVEDRFVTAESRLEENFLEAVNFTDDIEHIREQPIALPYSFAGQELHYTPDFIVGLRDGRTAIVEVKDIAEWADVRNVAKWDGAISFCSERGWGFMVTNAHSSPRELVAIADARFSPGARNDELVSFEDVLEEIGRSRRPEYVLATLAAGHVFDGLFAVERRDSQWIASLITPI